MNDECRIKNCVLAVNVIFFSENKARKSLIIIHKPKINLTNTKSNNITMLKINIIKI